MVFSLTEAQSERPLIGDDTILAELREKSQITIPEELVEKLGLYEGDKLEVFEQDGLICIMPVVVYPQKYLDEIQEEIEIINAKIASGEQPIFDNIDDMIAKLEET